MKKKGVGYKIIVSLITIIISCSFSISCYAASDWYDEELFEYADSYVSPMSTENKELYFIPIIPSTGYKNYFIFKSNGRYYAYCGEPGLGDSFYVYGGSRIINYEDYTMFYYEPGVSNDWVLMDGGAGYYNIYPGMVIIDTTKTVETYAIGSPVADRGIINRSSYRIYWTLALIEKQVLQWLIRISEYVLEHEILYYIVLACFIGELILSVFVFIKRVGVLRNEEDT